MFTPLLFTFITIAMAKTYTPPVWTDTPSNPQISSEEEDSTALLYSHYNTIEQRLSWALGVVSSHYHRINDIPLQVVHSITLPEFSYGIGHAKTMLDDQLGDCIGEIPNMKNYVGWARLAAYNPSSTFQPLPPSNHPNQQMILEHTAFNLGKTIADHKFWSKLHLMILSRLAMEPDILKQYINSFNAKSDVEAGFLPSEDELVSDNIVIARYLGWKMYVILDQKDSQETTQQHC